MQQSSFNKEVKVPVNKFLNSPPPFKTGKRRAIPLSFVLCLLVNLSFLPWGISSEKDSGNSPAKNYQWGGFLQKKWGLNLSGSLLTLDPQTEQNYTRHAFDEINAKGFSIGMSFLQNDGDSPWHLGFFSNFFFLPRQIKSTSTTHREARFNAISLGPLIQYDFITEKGYTFFTSLALGFGQGSLKVNPQQDEGVEEEDGEQVELEIKEKFYKVEPGLGWDFYASRHFGMSLTLSYPWVFVLNSERDGALHGEPSYLMETFKVGVHFYFKSKKCIGGACAARYGANDSSLYELNPEENFSFPLQGIDSDSKKLGIGGKSKISTEAKSSD